MPLENKTAVLYGGAGHIGSTVARAFAREGARVILTGRTHDTLDAIARDIVSAGGSADTAQVDATDPTGVEAHFASIVDQVGRRYLVQCWRSMSTYSRSRSARAPTSSMQPPGT